MKKISKMRFYFLTVATFLKLIVLIKSVLSENATEKSFSTSVASMEQLLFTEKFLIDTMEESLNELQANLDSIKNLISIFRKENQKALQNPEEYLHNPLNGYSLIRRMHYDWPKIELFMQKTAEDKYINILQSNHAQLPAASDLTEASEALFRMQITYDLQAKDMAKGILNGKQYSAKLNSIDRYMMGYHLCGKIEYFYAEFWLDSALESYEDSDYYGVLEFRKDKIWLLYAETLVNQNRYKDALAAIKKACKLQPSNAYMSKLREDIYYMLKANNLPPQLFIVPQPNPYELGCRGAYSNLTSRLSCLYNFTVSPFLRLAPLKMEILHLQPYMVLYHDVLTDQEILKLQDMTKPKLKRSKVYNAEFDKHVVQDVRTSQFSYFPDDFSNETLRIHERIKDMTGFDIKGSDALQVVNYGLGGHYIAHYDFFFNVSETKDVVRPEGDRIATVLFYLSDVEQGGATVFPNIKTAVFPRKGSAVLWYNLNDRLEHDLKTLHAACPVIVGSKWIANKWIRSKAQVFKKPCLK